mgnify:CR=1 FL=1
MNKELVVLRRHFTDENRCIKYFHGYVAEEPVDLQSRSGQIIRNVAKKAGFPVPK